MWVIMGHVLWPVGMIKFIQLYGIFERDQQRWAQMAWDHCFQLASCSVKSIPKGWVFSSSRNFKSSLFPSPPYCNCLGSWEQLIPSSLVAKNHRVYCTVSALSVPNCLGTQRRSSCLTLGGSHDLGGCISLPVSTFVVSFKALSCWELSNSWIYRIHNQWFINNAHCQDESLPNNRVRTRTRPFFSSSLGIRQSKHSVFLRSDSTSNSLNRCMHCLINLIVFLLILHSIYSNEWLSTGRSWTSSDTEGEVALPGFGSAECSSVGLPVITSTSSSTFSLTWRAAVGIPISSMSLQNSIFCKNRTTSFKFRAKNDMAAGWTKTRPCHLCYLDSRVPVRSHIIHWGI